MKDPDSVRRLQRARTPIGCRAPRAGRRASTAWSRCVTATVRQFLGGATAGSLLMFKGAYKALLINYPNRSQKEELIRSALSG